MIAIGIDKVEQYDLEDGTVLETSKKMNQVLLKLASENQGYATRMCYDCLLYTSRVVKNIKIGPSPKWMQRRLASVGIRPINNLVDITNYVMEEYGQPMHAYDLDTIAGGQIVVRRAKENETFVTLDGQERKLDESVLMICDGCLLYTSRCV